MKNIFIVGSRGYRFNYGGWETFVTNLVDNYNDKNTHFYVTCLTTNKKEHKKIVTNKNVTCIYLCDRNRGFTQMFFHTIKALWYTKKYIKKNKLENVSLYSLGCKMGPFYPFQVRPLKRMGVKLYLNPDGLEWKREKWNFIIKMCFKISERIMIHESDEIICDSKAIQEYIDKEYKRYKKKTHFIAYGSYLDKKANNNDLVKDLFKKYSIKKNNYYLVVARFVPENNFEVMIKEFMKSKTTKDLVIISNIENSSYYKVLQNQTNFESDKRIKFVGSFYDIEGLTYIRQNAYAYLHGHSAGGTNPSLLEALSTTKVNILYDVAYNKEVGEDACFYFSKKENDLKKIITKVDKLTTKEINELDKLSTNRIVNNYTWPIIVDKYKNIWK